MSRPHVAVTIFRNGGRDPLESRELFVRLIVRRFDLEMVGAMVPPDHIAIGEYSLTNSIRIALDRHPNQAAKNQQNRSVSDCLKMMGNNKTNGAFAKNTLNRFKKLVDRSALACAAAPKSDRWFGTK